MKGRATVRCSRKGSAAHNGRDFDTTIAGHIDQDRLKRNLYSTEEDFEKVELRYYQEHYEHDLARKNTTYIEQRHPERCKSIDQVYRSPKTKPEEIILQIGDKTVQQQIGQQDMEGLTDICLVKYFDWMNEWSASHHNCLHILTWAIHADETSVHVHIRRVWDYEHKGCRRIGQNEALKRAGLELPYPEKPEGKYNNRKITFDKLAREKWLDIVEEIAQAMQIDLDLIREPHKWGRRHLETEEYIEKQIEEKEKQLDELTGKVQYAANHPDELTEVRQQLDTALWEVEQVRKGSQEYMLELETMKAHEEDIKEYIKSEYRLNYLDAKLATTEEVKNRAIDALARLTKLATDAFGFEFADSLRDLQEDPPKRSQGMSL